jgi:hypothetical protein
MAIDMVKVRATISIGNVSVSTPYIQSFNVSKNRGQPSTFNAALKIEASSVRGTITGDGVVVQAGTDGNENTIFTGFIEGANTTPCWDDPNYVILNIRGADALKFLEGKKYTRRCRATRSTWVEIKSVDRPGLKSSKFAYKESSMLETTPSDPVKDGYNNTSRTPVIPDDIAKAPSGNVQNGVNLTIVHDPEAG